MEWPGPAEAGPDPHRFRFHQQTARAGYRHRADAGPVAAMSGPTPDRESGFALLLVLWTMALLALLVAQFTATGRSEVQIVSNLRKAAVTQAAADGAVHEAILRLLQGVWLPDSRPHRIAEGDTVVALRIRTLAWKVNPNTAPPAVLEALLIGTGLEARKAANLAWAVVDWRQATPQSLSGGLKLTQYQSAGLPYGPANRLYDSLDELGLVIGMTPASLARIRPLLSVYQDGEVPEPADAFAAASKEALPPTADPWQFGATGRVMVVMMEATATGAQGGQFTRQASVRLRAEPSLDQAPYQILTWDTPWQ
jgi:general secretion pathway protein K